MSRRTRLAIMAGIVAVVVVAMVAGEPGRRFLDLLATWVLPAIVVGAAAVTVILLVRQRLTHRRALRDNPEYRAAWEAFQRGESPPTTIDGTQHGALDHAASGRNSAVRNWMSRPVVTGTFFVAFTLFFLVLMVGYLEEANDLRHRGLETTARVVGIDQDTSDVTVEFTTARGDSVTAETDHRFEPRPNVGDTVRIRYVAHDPTVVAGTGPPDYFMVWLMGSGALLFGVVALLSYTGRINWRAINSRR
jgi:hypothetical protein